MFRRWSRLSLAVSAVVAVIGCASSPDDTHPPSRYGGTLRLTLEDNVVTLDPALITDAHSERVAASIYDTLIEIAERVDVSDDKRIWRVRIRGGVRFHDDPCFPDGIGRGVTAEDVVYSVTRLAAARTPNSWIIADRLEGGWEAHRGTSDRITGVGAEPPRTVVFRLARPCYFFPDLLEKLAFAVVPREAIERYGRDFGLHPVGSGPFRLGLWEANREVTLVRNPKCWQREEGAQLPYLDGIEFRIQPDKIAAVDMLRRGEIDFVSPPSPTPPPGRRLRSNYVLYLGFNLSRPNPFARDARLRRAVSLAIDRARLAGMNPGAGQDRIATGLIPIDYPGYTTAGTNVPFDPERARRLIAQAGYQSTRARPALDLYCKGTPDSRSRCLLVKENLEAIGISVRVVPRTLTNLLSDLDAGLADSFLLGWTNTYENLPEAFLHNFCSRFIPSPNRFRYEAARFDEAYDRLLSAADGRERDQSIAELERILSEDVPAAFLVNDQPTHETDGWISPRLRFPNDPTARPLYRNFHRIWFER